MSDFQTTIFERLLTYTDFLPDCYVNHDGLRYRYSGRIYNAFFGIKGQRLYDHHFIGHSTDMRRRGTYSQMKAGRFVDRTSLSGCILTMVEDSMSGSSFGRCGFHVLYTPLRGAGVPLTDNLTMKLDEAFHFDRQLSVVPHNDEFQGPHPALRRQVK